MQSSKQDMWKGYRLSIEGIRRGIFYVKNGISKGKGLDLGAEPPRIRICWVPPGIRSECQGQGLKKLRHDPNNGCEGDYVWKGIHGIRDFDEIHSGIRVNSKFLDRIRICSPLGKRDSPKSWHGCDEKENGMRDRGGKSSGCGILVKKKRGYLLSRPC